MKYKSWTYEEDKLVLKLGNTDKLRKALKHKSKAAITRRYGTLRREGATIEYLEYEENFIRTGYKNLSQRAITTHLKVSEGRVNQRIRSMKPGIKNEKEITITKEEIEALECKNNKEIMKEFNLKDYEVAVRRAILSERKRKEQTKKKAKKAMKSYHLQKDEAIKVKIMKYKKLQKSRLL